jgi:ribosomal protein L40E
MGERELVYCTKCGAQNEDTAVVCVKCGASLQTRPVESQRYEKYEKHEKRREDECFGLPHGGAIAGIVIGGLILLWGIVTLALQQGWITSTPDLGWLVLIIFGVLIVAGAIYRMSRRP